MPDPVSVGFIISAFIAGLLTFLAPCTLPLLPAYLGFISGISAQDMQNPAMRDRVRSRVLKNGIIFVLGFSVVFVVFGALAGLVGEVFAPWRFWMGRIGGALVILFGLFMLGVLRLPALSSEHRANITKWVPIGTPVGSFAIGGAFAFGWTPCVGPILGSILLLAGTSATALSGALLLAVFSLGLALPFIALAFGFAHATRYVDALGPFLKWVSVIGGIFLIGLGILLATGNFGLTISYGYQLFDFINYDRLLDYL